MSRIIKRELSEEKTLSEKDVVLFLEDNLKRVPCGDYFSDCPWGVEENQQLYIAIDQFYDKNPIKPNKTESYETDESNSSISLEEHQKSIGLLYNADPNCWHELEEDCLGGIHCTKCEGWFCF